MFPLLKKDGLAVAYWSVMALCWAVTSLIQAASPKWDATSARSRLLEVVQAAGFGLMVVVHLVGGFASPPARYPYIFDAAIMSLACVQYAAIFAFTYNEQWREFRAAKTKVD